MDKGQAKGLLRHLRRVAFQSDAVGLADGELLECYLTWRDEAAFEALLRRHGPMVLGVCRRLLRNEADAHDAFQATFLVFVRKAASIMPRARVGSWLYGVAHKTALKATAMNRRRRAREQQAAGLPRPSASGERLEELRALLDESLSRLPDKYRAVIVLCHLEERSLQEAARLLGCPLGTVASRLARARQKLARSLTRGGLSLGSEALVAALARSAAPVTPSASLNASTVVAAAAAGQAAVAGEGSAAVALADGVVRAMRLPKWKTLTGGLLGLALLGSGVAALSRLLPGAARPAARAEAMPQVAVPQAGKARPDEEALQGTWVARSGQRNAERLTGRQFEPWARLVFAGVRFTRDGPERVEGTYTLAPDRNPKEIELTAGPAGWKGIYELNGTTLKLALPTGDEPPADFSPGAGRLIVIYQKK
jgi:RNA polymerase sigma-70 factor (ECF subfamily)